MSIRSRLIAIDVAILPPADVSQQAMALNAALPAAEGEGLRLDAEHLPHVTLIQLFVRRDELDVALDQIGAVLEATPALPLHVSGAGQSRQTVWLTIRRTPQVDELHRRLMDALRGIERHPGTAAAFVDGEARPGDVIWVNTYRAKAAFGSFTPHVTLGHAKRPPHVEPFDFDATTVAACHLGRFCTCRRVLREWTLSGRPDSPPDTHRPPR